MSVERSERSIDSEAVETLRALDEVGAISLDVLMKNAPEVKSALSKAGVMLEEGDICYKFTIHIGPRMFDLVSVSEEIQRLGYRVERMG